MAFAVYDPPSNALSAAILLASLLANGSAFLAFAVLAEKRGLASVDLGRGCPFQCSFCTIINVQARKSRYRTPDDLERIIRENYAQNIKRFFVTDDNFARNRNWEAFLDRLIELREDEGLDIKFTIQVDTLCHKIPNFTVHTWHLPDVPHTGSTSASRGKRGPPCGRVPVLGVEPTNSTGRCDVSN